MVPDEVNVYLWRKGFHLLFPMRGKDHWRIVGILPPELRDRDDLRFEDVMPSLRSEAGAGLVLQDLHLVLHLPHPPSQRRALPRPPLLPARRRGAHPQPGRRAGHEHRPAGCLQPGLEAGAGGRGPGRTRRCSTPTRPSACRSRGGCCNTTDRALPAGRVRQLACRPVAHAGPGPARRLRDEPRAHPGAGLPHRLADRHPLPRRARCRRSLDGLPDGAPRAGDRFPWLRLQAATPTGRSRTCSRRSTTRTST